MTASTPDDAGPGRPLATYRLQLNGGFTFTDAAALVPYLAELGVSHLYASPYLKARPGSTHGYDIIDHLALNPEVGSEAEHAALVRALHAHGLGHILDIVPNHMGIMGADNRWWLDVLENGRSSRYAGFFDIDWQPLQRELAGKVLVPVLGDQYGAVLERGELQLRFDAEAGEFSVYYYEHRFPIDPREYPAILSPGLEQMRAAAGETEDVPELESLCAAFGHLPSRDSRDSAAIEERQRDKEIHKRHLARLCEHSAPIRRHIEARVEALNASHAELLASDGLHTLLERQAWRLAFWRVATDEINYRRFFDINDLAGLRTERAEVFETTHQLVLNMIERGDLDGLRIDHPDGLYDPAEYFSRLRAAVRERRPQSHCYIIAEKILAEYEHLPEDWPIEGTTGYDFAVLLNGLYVDPERKAQLDRSYRRFTGQSTDFVELLYEAKQLIMQTALASELAVLANQLNRLSESDPRTRDFTMNALREALREIAACFPVYRTYINATGASEADRRYLAWAVAQAKKRQTSGETSVYDFIHDALLLHLPEGPGRAARRLLVEFSMKFQQFSSPVMAKGMEDTAFYRYLPLASANEVGAEPDRPITTPAAFHHQNIERLRRWPDSMLGSTTHDTKRSEDVRARINLISEVPKLWQRKLAQWARMNASRKTELDEGPAPSANHEYLLYQTLLGTWPLAPPDAAGWDDYRARISAYLLKAAREGKRETSWITPNEAYEQALARFIDGILERRETNLFVEDFAEFQHSFAQAGMLNSLSQTLLKLTAPGVPDIYRGTELWDFSLVDPDNRRPVDYNARRHMLHRLRHSRQPRAVLTRQLLAHREAGWPKLYLLERMLHLRRQAPALFRRGEYIPLEVSGPYAEHVVAFARASADGCCVVVAPRLLYRLTDGGRRLPLGDVWAGTALQLPAGLPINFRNVFSGRDVTTLRQGDLRVLDVAAALDGFPVAALVFPPRLAIGDGD